MSAGSLAPLALALALLAGACADGTGAGPAAGPLGSPVPGPTETVTPVPDGDVYFAALRPLNSIRDSSGAGILTERDGCVILRSARESPDVLPLWWHGYSYEDGRLLDPEGEEVARLGQWVAGGGGGVGDDWDHIDGLLLEPVPKRCRVQVRDAVMLTDIRHAPEFGEEHP